MVLFAGIAAEVLVYGEAEGGENDENLFRSTCVILQPPLSVAEVSLWLICWICDIFPLTSENTNTSATIFMIILERCLIKQDGLCYNLTIF